MNTHPARYLCIVYRGADHGSEAGALEDAPLAC
jgi:hypothetical protein